MTVRSSPAAARSRPMLNTLDLVSISPFARLMRNAPRPHSPAQLRPPWARGRNLFRHSGREAIREHVDQIFLLRVSVSFIACDPALKEGVNLVYDLADDGPKLVAEPVRPFSAIDAHRIAVLVFSAIE